jgi:hypothetical protein
MVSGLHTPPPPPPPSAPAPTDKHRCCCCCTHGHDRQTPLLLLLHTRPQHWLIARSSRGWGEEGPPASLSLTCARCPPAAMRWYSQQRTASGADAEAGVAEQSCQCSASTRLTSAAILAASSGRTASRLLPVCRNLTTQRCELPSQQRTSVPSSTPEQMSRGEFFVRWVGGPYQLGAAIQRTVIPPTAERVHARDLCVVQEARHAHHGGALRGGEREQPGPPRVPPRCKRRPCGLIQAQPGLGLGLGHGLRHAGRHSNAAAQPPGRGRQQAAAVTRSKAQGSTA